MELPSPERLSVARELHDGIAQDLVGIGYSLDLLLAESSLSNAVRSQLRDTRLEIDNLISKVRSEILRLRQADSLNLATEVQKLLENYKYPADLTFTSENVDTSEVHTQEVIAIVTEILRNIERHSGATQVAINLYPINNRTCLEICDNGIGGAQMEPGHYGLQGIIERVNSIGGSITIENNEGTRIAILI